MNNDYMFEDEVDQEAAEELRKQREAELKKSTENSQNSQNTNTQNTNSQNTNTQNTYSSYSYTSYNSNQYTPAGKKTGTGPATASLVLGIISLVFFCSCINVVTAVLAIIFGIVYMSNYDLSQGKARAIVGIITAGLSIGLLVFSYEMISQNTNITNFLEDDYFRDYYNEFNGDNFYNYDEFDEYKDLNDFFNDFNNEQNGDYLEDYLNNNEKDNTL